jgi:hypothetical protein
MLSATKEEQPGWANGCRLAPEASSTYARPVLSVLSVLSVLRGSFDRWIANAIVRRAQRRWLPLRLLPATWLRPLVKPSATLIRGELSRIAVRTTAFAGVLVSALLLLGFR